MFRFGDAFSTVMHVMLRKSMNVYQDLAHVLLDLGSILISVFRFSSTVMRRSNASVSTRHHSPMSSGFTRHDR
nr:hypothetical protein A4A49_21077 [Ipomoea trifida]